MTNLGTTRRLLIRTSVYIIFLSYADLTYTEKYMFLIISRTDKILGQAPVTHFIVVLRYMENPILYSFIFA